jgi:hypothetical protein
MKKTSLKIAAVAMTMLPLLVFAQTVYPANVPTTGIKTLSDVSRIIANIVTWITGLFFVVAILFIFYAAYLYLGAAGDPERLTKAKNQLIYSVIAIAVALLAGSVRFIVENILK